MKLGAQVTRTAASIFHWLQFGVIAIETTTNYEGMRRRDSALSGPPRPVPLLDPPRGDRWRSDSVAPKMKAWDKSVETKYILPEDIKAYGDFCLHHLRSLALRRSMVPLYHYTSGESLIRIIESGQLWSTQIACLNDAKEVIHATELLRDAIKVRLDAGTTPAFGALLEKMDEILAIPIPEVAGAFVVCFSERGDDLSQWRAYGGPGGGYSIEFEQLKFREAAALRNGILVPVAYDRDTKDVLISDVIKWSETYFMDGLTKNRAPTQEDWIDEFARYWLWTLSFLAPIIKHPAFESEMEWRLIYHLKEQDRPKMKFTQRQLMMVRHIPLTFAEPNAAGYTLLPISKVVVGPTMHQRLSQIGVGDLLAAHGYRDQVKVQVTNIPFRTVR